MGVVVFPFSPSFPGSCADSVVLLPWAVVMALSLKVVVVFFSPSCVPGSYDESILPLPWATVTSATTLSIIESALVESISMSSYSRDPAF